MMGKNKSEGEDEAKTSAESRSERKRVKALSKKLLKALDYQKAKIDYAIGRSLFGLKLLWFRESIEPVEEYTAPMLEQLFEKYLSRFEEELEQLGQEGNNSLDASRENIINLTIKSDLDEYNTSGIEMVDILSKQQLQMFREWDGKMDTLDGFRIKRFSRSYLANYQPPQSKGTITDFCGVFEENYEMRVSDDNEAFETDEVTYKCEASSTEDLEDQKVDSMKPAMDIF